MSVRNLHIFSDKAGFFVKKTVEFCEELGVLEENVFLNIQANSATTNKQILNMTVNHFLSKNTDLQVSKVIFHSFHYYNVKDIAKIKEAYPNNKIKFLWIFWSHEFYQLPHNFKDLYTGLSQKFLLRKYISFYVEYFMHFLKGNVTFPIYSGLNSFEKHFSEIDMFCSFVKGDFDVVMQNNPEVNYHSLAYLTIKDFPKFDLNFQKKNSDIMIGHAGSPILNHYEVVEKLEKFNVSNKIVIPLSYGKKEYIELLKAKLANKNNLNIDIIEKYLPKEVYYSKLNNIGVFILNSNCQQALGNIIYLLWIGTKIFLSKHSTTYTTLIEKSFFVYSIEDEMTPDSLVNLTESEKKHNHQLLKESLSEAVVLQQWKDLLCYQ